MFQSEFYHKASSMSTKINDVLMLAKIIVTFVLSMTSIAYQSSVNNFVVVLLLV